MLLGTTTFIAGELPDLPAVGNNVTDLARVLTSPRGTGLLPENCTTLVDEADLTRIGDTVITAAEQAEDLLLVYYAGHGLIDRNGLLYLSLPATRQDPDRVGWTALSLEMLRGTLSGAKAANRLLILDCCFSGLAIDLMGDVTSAVAGQLEVAGTCTLASSPANRPSRAPADARHTAYTGELLEVLRRGPDDGHELLTIFDIHDYLAKALPAKGFPRPEQRNTRTIGRLALASGPTHASDETDFRPPDSGSGDRRNRSPSAHRRTRWYRPISAIALLTAAIIGIYTIGDFHRAGTSTPATAGASTLSTAPPATAIAPAGTIYVYLVVNASACPPGSSPMAIKGSVEPTGWSTDWDVGDAVVYPLVAKDVSNTAHLDVRCDSDVGGRSITATSPHIDESFTPTQSRQSVRVG
ncbi:caspase family protein [Nocardia aurantia]|uniref:Peptidase C14 caspase domain-containing protein n=1 Tax=Nocardia aurantia TaxID=2585199 RepID=A0A7K0DL59_9NOCA|nr:caspase family protein [Nocardia aurantia]MQY25992.1 hypothetical protein [Nocardia aurantia]